ncbi:NAD(P)H-hydrate dehydratase [Roseomonas elaeocarpi]|uniref:ADP-dependent (S)-NAD(P)H-hydrate dehydratase n=1 Tax=Roseomonas elaeocarpi TaxID=907779 RepID=A0ABV6JY90_9PROT
MSELVELTPALLRSMPLPSPESGDKESRGRVMVVGGSREVPGAVLLAGTAALRAGAGKLQLAVGAAVAPQLAVAVPESRAIALPETAGGAIDPAAAETLAARADTCAALVIGPGMVEAGAAAALTGTLLERVSSPGLVIDAAAMSGLREQRRALQRHGGRAIITPHAGEMANLLGTEKAAVEGDPLGTARRAAEELGVVVIMKGATTRIVTPDGEGWIFRGGSIGLATSGSGDVLAGVIGGLLARGAAPAQAALWGVYLHGEAGHRLGEAQGGPLGFLARELPPLIPRLMAGLSPGTQ